MGWYSILPSYLTVVETWIVRVAIFCAVINISPWLLVIVIDLFLYLYRQVWYWIPIWGGRARGQTRPRAPSLNGARRRTLSLAGLMGKPSPGRIREEHFRPTQEPNPGDKSFDVIGEDEEPATLGNGVTGAPASGSLSSLETTRESDHLTNTSNRRPVSR